MFAHGLAVRVQHVEGCDPEHPHEGCDETIDPYLHDQRISWVRLDPSVNVGLGRGFVASAGVPFDVRVLRIDYSTLDGEPYDPPEGDIHHRDETLWGPVDARLVVRWFGATEGGVVGGGGIGTTLPIGKIEANPYALTELGLEHQHFQFGTGTFDPIATAQLAWAGERWGWFASADARVPLYANRETYRAPLSTGGSVGPSFRVAPPVALYATVDPSFEGPEHWGGEAYGGRTSVLSTLGATWTRERLVWQVQGRTTVWQASGGEHDEGQIVQRLVLSLGFSTRPAADAD